MSQQKIPVTGVNTKTTLRVLVVTYSDFLGGASRAISRIHSALVKFGPALGVLSTLRVIVSDGKTPDVVAGFPEAPPLRRFLRVTGIKKEALKWSLFRFLGGDGLISTARISTGLGAEIEGSDADVVLLNWLGDQTVSIEELSKISKPVILRNADMWFLLPITHYPKSSTGKSLGGLMLHLLGYVLFFQHEKRRERVKREFLKKNVVGTVSPSAWLRDVSAAHQSLGGKENVHIPNTIDTDFWFPVSKAEARSRLGIAGDDFSIGFGAAGGLRDPRKGGTLMLKAFQSLQKQFSSDGRRLRLDIFGQDRPVNGLGLESVFFHGIMSSEQLKDFYSAIDIFVTLPSVEGFPNTVVEAASCGTPTIAPNVPGMPDIIEDHVSGMLVTRENVDELVDRIEFVYHNEDWLHDAGVQARQRALTLWAPSVIARRYADFFLNFREM